MVSQMKQIKYICIFICLMSIVLGLNGCGNYSEVNRLAFVIGFAVDKPDPTKDLYQVTFQIVKPNQTSNPTSGGGGQGVPVVNYTGIGRTISEAARNSSKKISRKSFYAHTAVVIIDENTAKDSIIKVTDALQRDPKIPSRVPVIIARDTSAQSILKAITPLDSIPSESLINQIYNTETVLGESSVEPVIKIVQRATSVGTDVFISGIGFQGNPEEASKIEELESQEPFSLLITKGIGLFRNDKLVHWMDGKKARALQIANNTLRQTNVTVPCGNHKFISVTINKSKAKTKVELKNKIPVVNLKAKMDGNIEEVTCAWNFNKPKTIEKIEKKAGEIIEKEIKQAIIESSDNNCEAFSLGHKLAIHHPKQWDKNKKNWNQLEKKAKLNVKVELSIERTGMRTNVGKERE